MITMTLKQQIFILNSDVLIISVIQCAAFGLHLREFFDKRGQLIFDRCIEARAQGAVALMLFALCAPLASVIQARNARHGEQHAVQRVNLLFVV